MLSNCEHIFTLSQGPKNLVNYLTLLALHWIWILPGSAPYTLSGTARLREYRIPVTGPTGVPNGLPTAYWTVATASYRYSPYSSGGQSK